MRTSRWIEGSGRPERAASSLRPISPPGVADDLEQVEHAADRLHAAVLGWLGHRSSACSRTFAWRKQHTDGVDDGRVELLERLPAEPGSGPVDAAGGPSYSLRQAEDKFHNAEEGRMRFEVNLSILFTELPLLERPRPRGRRASTRSSSGGPGRSPSRRTPRSTRSPPRSRDAGVQLVGLNFFAGDMAGGDRGLVSWPARSTEFRDNIDVTVGHRRAAGLPGVQRALRQPDRRQHARRSRTRWPPRTSRSRRGRRSGSAAPCSSSRSAARPATRCSPRPTRWRRSTGRGEENIALLLDVYHLAVNGDDVDAAIDAAAGRIGHVQIADAPGRNEPGTGKLDIDRYLDRIAATGYDGWVGLEYKPTGASADAFDWLPRERRSAR